MNRPQIAKPVATISRGRRLYFCGMESCTNSYSADPIGLSLLRDHYVVTHGVEPERIKW